MKLSVILKWLFAVLLLASVAVVIVLFQRTSTSQPPPVEQARPVVTTTATTAPPPVVVKENIPAPKPIETAQPVTKSVEHPVIFGIVMDENSNPVSSVQITFVISVTSGSSVQRMSDKKEKKGILTDISGEYKTPVLAVGKYTVYADCNGYQLAKENAEIVDVNNDVRLDVQLKKGGFISGKVTDESNRPIKDVKIKANGKHQEEGNDCDCWAIRSAETNEEGKYEVWGLSAQSCWISAKAEDYVSIEYKTAKLNSSDVDFILKTGGRMEIRVIDKITKEPVKQDEVKIDAYWKKTRNSSHSRNWDVSTTEDGSFLLKGLPAGDYGIQVSPINKGCYKPPERKEDVKVTAGETTKGIVIELEKGGSIEGKVIDGATKLPVKDCRFSYDKKRDDGRYHGYFGGYNQTVSKEDGSFFIGGLEDGAYVVKANTYGQNYAPKESDEITIKDAGAVSGIIIELGRGGSIEGAVVDKITKAPIKGCRVTPQADKPDYPYGFAQSLTGDDGRFILGGLRDGTYTVETGAHEQNYISVKSSEITIKDANTVTGITLELETGGFISGKVVDDNNSPLKDINVSANMREGSGRGWREYGYSSARTDEDGRYKLLGLKDGSYAVRVNDYESGYVQGEKDDVKVNSSDVDFVLCKGGKIVGKLIDKASRMPVGEKDVYLSCDEDKGDSESKTRRWSTRYNPVAWETDGAFTIENLKPGRYSIEVRSRNSKYKETTYKNIEVVAGQTTSGIIIELEPGGPTNKINGVVLEQGTRKPVKGVYVSGYPAKPSRERFYGGNATTDESGAFTLEGLSPNQDYRLSVHSDKYAPNSVTISLLNIDISGVEILLAKGGCIKGAVKDSTGQALARRNIMGLSANIKSLADMASLRGEGAIPLYTNTDDKGQFEIRGVAPGKYKLFVLEESSSFFGLPDLDNFQKEVEITSDETVTCEIIFDKVRQSLCKVSGKLLKGGLPVANEQIMLIESNMISFTPAQAETSEDGSYSLEVKPGKYFIMGDQVKYGEITVPNQIEYRFDIIVAVLHLKGRVLDQQNQAPLDNARIIVLRKTNEQFSGWQSLLKTAVGGTETDENGNFTMENMQDGDFIIQVAAENYAAVMQEVRIAQASIEDILINMSAGGSVRGRVIDHAGNPVSNTSFSIENIDIGIPIFDFDGPFSGNVSDNDGAYRLKNIRGGRYRLTAVSTGFAFAIKDISVTDGAETVLDFTLTKGGCIKIKVNDEAGNPADKVNIALKTKEGAMLDNIFTQSPEAIFGAIAATDKNGAYERKNIAAGEYTGTLKKDGYQDTSFTFTITENQDTALDLVIKK
ncbi:MAG: carboxypeptidase regulatory-like domain-containing protein [Planctomycetota bacterium]